MATGSEILDVQEPDLVDSPLKAARELVDASYHGHYMPKRQRFQAFRPFFFGP